jgi:ATP-dependent Clp protease protease subunit
LGYFNRIELAREIAIRDNEPGETGESFVRRLRSLGAERELSLSIDSEGGGAAGMWDILTAIGELRDRGVVLTAHASHALSAAAAIAVACDRRIAKQGSRFMVHACTCPACPKCDCADLTSRYRDYLAARTGNSKACVEAWVKAETWFDENDALRHGFATHISPFGRVFGARDLAGKNRP